MFPSMRADARRPLRLLLGLPLAAVLVAATFAVVPAPRATADEGAAAPLARTPAAAPAIPVVSKKKAKRWKPKSGPIFNSAVGSLPKRYRIHNQIQTSIRRARKGSTVKIMSWNVMSASATSALLGAQRRGVKIRVLMDRLNTTEVPNPEWRRLVTGLKAGNKGRKNDRKSFAKTCRGSCRGKRGQAHAKFYLFGHTGGAKKVVMQGSANLTQAAATNQWNDLYTTIGNKDIYSFAETVFDQMWEDKPVADAYTELQSGRVRFYFSPFTGANYKGDPYQQLLRQVQCTGARDGAGNKKRRTVIRVAPDVMRNERGMRAAVELKRLWDAGCDVRIGYTVMGVAIFRFLKRRTGRGPVPMRHLVQDFDGDKDFDNYFHLKALTVNGVVGGDRSAYYTINGSSNLSGAATVSDENIMLINKKSVTKKYQNHINFWYENFPSVTPATAVSGGGDAARMRMTGRLAGKVTSMAPYVHVDMD